MKFIISGKNIVVTEALKERTEKKVGKLEKYFSHEMEAHATLNVEKNRQMIELTIHCGGMVFRAEVSDADMYASIDRAIDIIEGQIRKNKTKLEKRMHKGALKADLPELPSGQEEEHEFKVVRSKKFFIKPMTVDEAILQMNLLGHEFYMFSNEDSKEINIVYQRKNGDYGLIEPEF